MTAPATRHIDQNGKVDNTSLAQVLTLALSGATWLTLTDQAAVLAAKRLAAAIDSCDDHQVLDKLMGRFLGVLQQLHMTPATRLDAGEVGDDGANIQAIWDGLPRTAAKKPTGQGGGNRRRGSSAAS